MTSFYIHVIHANADLLVALTVIPVIEVLLFSVVIQCVHWFTSPGVCLSSILFLTTS